MLDNRMKELIAVGASITANCQPCLQYHIAKAVESGAAEQEVKEAVEVGKMVRKGAAAKMDKLVSSLAQPVPSTAATPDEDRGCAA